MFPRRTNEASNDVDSVFTSSSNSSEDTCAPSEISNEHSDLASIITSSTDQTLVNRLKVFSESASSYRSVRECPIVSNILQQSVSVFTDSKSLDTFIKRQSTSDGAESGTISPVFPLLQTSTPVLSIFKRHAPYMVIYKYSNPTERRPFCKIYFRILCNNVSCYILVFSFDDGTCETLVVLNSGIKPSSDAIYKNSKIRIIGSSGAASTFASGLIQMFIMKDSSPSLADDLILEHAPSNIETGTKKMKITVPGSNKLYTYLSRQDRSKFFDLNARAEKLIQVPFGTFIDNGDTKIKGSHLRRNGTIRLFESSGTVLNNTTLVSICMLLVLREVEFRKNRGNKRPAFVRS